MERVTISVKKFVTDQTAILSKQINDAEEAIKVLRGLGRSTALEEAKLEEAKQTLANLQNYIDDEE
jgi:hypothetical protein